MKPRDIFTKTLPFVWAKLLLWLVTLVVSVIWALILGAIAALSKNGVVAFFCFCFWAGGAGLVRFLLMRYFGYLVKAGHIAVIAEAVVTGKVPDNQIEYGKRKVTERFVTANVFFVVDNLVSGAVKQLQRVVGKVGDLFKFIPGMKFVTDIAKMFIEISLGYVDECCLGYAFYKEDEGAFKSSCDGVVIYAQNWKKLLANAAKTMVKVLLVMLAIVIVFGLIFGAIIGAISNHNQIAGFLAFGFAVLVAVAVKSAVLDSYILCATMAVYMDVAPDTVITYNLYDKLCGLSKKFRDLFNKAKEEQPSMAEPAYAGAGAEGGAGSSAYGNTDTAAYANTGAAPYGSAGAGQPSFCGNCGAKIEAGVKFCGSCGAQIK